MPLDFFRKLRENKEEFTITNFKLAPEGLTTELLWKIWSMCIAYGSEKENYKAVIYNDNSTFFAIAANISQKIQRPALFVSTLNDKNPINTQNHFVFKLKNRVLVFWHCTFTVNHIKSIIDAIEEDIKTALLLKALGILKRKN